MIADSLINPFGVAESEELPHARQAIKDWTEYCYFFGYDPKNGYGVSIHIGREPTDTEIWRGTFGVYLPDQQILVAKYFGRNGSDRGPGAGPLQLRCIEPMRLWSVEFSGLAERVSRTAIMNDVHHDSPAELASFYLTFEAAAPLWDLEGSNIAPKMVLVKGKHDADEKEKLKLNHYEQICRVRGSVTVNGNVLRIDGAGVRDHSYGPRDYEKVIGSAWVNATFPSGKSIMVMATRVGDNFIRGGYIFRNDGTPLEVVQVLEHPFVGDNDTAPNSLAADPLTDRLYEHVHVVVATKRGKEIITGKIHHAMGTTYLTPNFELVGSDLARVKGGSQLAECPATFEWGGEMGAGLYERIAAMRHLKRTN